MCNGEIKMNDKTYQIKRKEKHFEKMINSLEEIKLLVTMEAEKSQDITSKLKWLNIKIDRLKEKYEKYCIKHRVRDNE